MLPNKRKRVFFNISASTDEMLQNVSYAIKNKRKRVFFNISASTDENRIFEAIERSRESKLAATSAGPARVVSNGGLGGPYFRGNKA